jgi:hypothetical protein
MKMNVKKYDSRAKGRNSIYESRRKTRIYERKLNGKRTMKRAMRRTMTWK